MQHTNRIPILCTRPLSRELIKTGDKKGFQIDVVPFIRTEPIQSDELRSHIRDLSARPVTAIFTSMNAAEALIKELNGSKPLWTLFCIGNTTRETLVRYFGKEAIAGFAANASFLANTIIKDGNVGETIFFCGDQRRDELPVILTQAGIKIQEVIMYKTIQIDNKISQSYQGILFFSPSAVTSFFSNNTIEQHTVLFAIGATTAAAIKNYTGNTIVTSERAGKEDLVKTMIAYYEERKLERIFN